jgi:hypothetical protein
MPLYAAYMEAFTPHPLIRNGPQLYTVRKVCAVAAGTNWPFLWLWCLHSAVGLSGRWKAGTGVIWLYGTGAKAQNGQKFPPK